MTVHKSKEKEKEKLEEKMHESSNYIQKTKKCTANFTSF